MICQLSKRYLPETFAEKGATAYNQFVKRFIRENGDGTISVTDVCSVAGLGEGIKTIGMAALIILYRKR